MNNIMKFFKKGYIYINYTFLFLTIYVILFPFISTLIQKIYPQFGICPYLRMTGKPCPLCGGTRYVKGLPKVFSDVTYLFHPFGIMMIIIFIELIFRIYCITTKKSEKSDKFIKIDFITHLIILLCFVIYEIVFFIINK